jgi:replicative DNA helicase
MAELAGAGKAIEIVTLVELLSNHQELAKVGDFGYISSLLDGAVARESVVHLVRELIDKARRRKAVAGANVLLAQPEDASVSTAECLSGIRESLLVIEAEQPERTDRTGKELMAETAYWGARRRR